MYKYTENIQLFASLCKKNYKIEIKLCIFLFCIIISRMKKLIVSLFLLSTFVISLSAQSLFIYDNYTASQVQLTSGTPNRPTGSDETNKSVKSNTPNRPGKSSKPNRPGNSSGSSKSDDNENTTLAGIFFEILFEISNQIWIFSHMNADYDIAPYANRPKYIDFKAEEWETEKFYRYTFETGVFFFPQDLTIGNESRIEGITYKFFGPVFENTIFTSFKPVAENNYWLEGNLRLGGAINLVNFNVFNAALHLQWSHWYGLKTIDGLNIGFILRSYPIKPVLLEWRVNWQAFLTEENYSDFSAYFESNLELGIMTGKRTELYAAWKYVNDRYNDIIKNGASTGVKLHF